MKNTLSDDAGTFEVMVSRSGDSDKVALFAVGAGGLPERYVSLLNALVNSGFTVIAPHVERLTSAYPSEAEITLRASRLSLALDAFSDTSVTIIGVGHSIGATTLLAMSGAQMWLGPNQPLAIPFDNRLTKLALLAPPTGFFQAPGALDLLAIPVEVWVGSEDSITPPAQSQYLATAAPEHHPITVHIEKGAGHFSFMDNGPPHMTEPLRDKPAFLNAYSNHVCDFLNQQDR